MGKPAEAISHQHKRSENSLSTNSTLFQALDGWMDLWDLKHLLTSSVTTSCACKQSPHLSEKLFAKPHMGGKLWEQESKSPQYLKTYLTEGPVIFSNGGHFFKVHSVLSIPGT